MKQIDMIKAYAELEGVKLNGEVDGHPAEFKFEDGELMHRVYNPITDLALMGKAIIDHKVNINHEYHTCYPAGHTSSMAHFYDKPFGHAIIECILKSAGKME